MTTQLPWCFEPCSPEDATDPKGTPWAHAVRGRKPQRPTIMGYGHTPSAADADARTKATQQDAREVLGERGEVIATSERMGGFEITPEMWEACRHIADEGLVVKAKLGGDLLRAWKMAVVRVSE